MSTLPPFRGHWLHHPRCGRSSIVEELKIPLSTRMPRLCRDCEGVNNRFPVPSAELGCPTHFRGHLTASRPEVELSRPLIRDFAQLSRYWIT